VIVPAVANPVGSITLAFSTVAIQVYMVEGYIIDAATGANA
jgi:hypothetical protein